MPSTLKEIIKDKMELVNKDLRELIEVTDGAIRDLEEEYRRNGEMDKEEIRALISDLESEKTDLGQAEGRISRIIKRLMGEGNILDNSDLMKCRWVDFENRVMR